MGIFDRLSRLARAEANHLGERVKDAISGVSASDRYGTADGSEADQPEIEPDPTHAHADGANASGANANEGSGRSSNGHGASSGGSRGHGSSGRGDGPTGARWPRDVRDAYAALSLPLGASRSEVRAAYKRLLHAHHPDKHQDDGEAERRATERTMKIRAAWERLDDFLPKE